MNSREVWLRLVGGLFFAALSEGETREHFVADAIEAGREVAELLRDARAEPYACDRSVSWQA